MFFRKKDSYAKTQRSLLQQARAGKPQRGRRLRKIALTGAAAVTVYYAGIPAARFAMDVTRQQETMDASAGQAADAFNEAARHINLLGETASRFELSYPKVGNVRYGFSFHEKWYAMMGRHHMLMQDPAHRAVFDDFVEQFAPLKNKSRAEIAKAVDEAVDLHLVYAEDNKNYVADEYFSSPVESIRKKTGDCDDYAILKYMVLRALGFSADDVYVVAIPEHAVAMVNTGTTENPAWHVLDNDNTGILLPQDKTEYYNTGRFAANERSIWLFPSITSKMTSQGVKP